MTIHHKIIIALLMSVLLIQTFALLGTEGIGHFVVTFIYAGFIFAGAYIFVSAVDRLAYEKRSDHRQNALKTKDSETQTPQDGKNGLKIVR